MAEYKTKKIVSASSIVQHKYVDIAKADKVISKVLPIPSVVLADASTATLVGKGNLLRIIGNGTAFIAFGASDIAVPDVNTQNAILTPNEWFFVVASDDYVRTSAAIRIEVINE
jgi:hypothetical protein